MSSRPPLSDEVRVGREVMETLRAAGITEEDPDFASLFSAECDGLDRVRRIIHAARKREWDAKVCNERAAVLRETEASHKRAVESLRKAALWAMSEMGVAKVSDPEFTASVAAGRPKVIVTNPALVPNELCRITREPNKTLIAEALAVGGNIAGAELSNPVLSLTVRTR